MTSHDSTAPPSSGEPLIALPLLKLLVAQWVAAVAVIVTWGSIGAVAVAAPGRWLVAGSIGAGVVTIAAAATTLLGVPWRAKPASTALLVWLGCTTLRMMVSPAALLLIYSAPFAERWPTVADAKAPVLFAMATAFVAGLLLEVWVIARHLRGRGPLASPTLRSASSQV